MEEPKKVLRCHYLGEVEVAKPTGVDTINNAMEKVYSRVPPEKWHFASVAVAPSTITVSEHTVSSVMRNLIPGPPCYNKMVICIQ